MDTRKTIILAFLAILWIDVIGRLAIFIAACYQYDGALPSFDSIGLRIWPMIILYFGGVIVITIGSLIYVFTGYDIPEAHSGIVKKIGPILIIFFVITVWIAFIPEEFLDLNEPFVSWLLLALCLAPGILYCLPYIYELVNPLTEEQVSDVQTRELFLNLPYDEAFAAGKEIIYAIDAEDITENLRVDPASGTIFVKAIPGIQSLMAKKPSHITLLFDGKKSGSTHMTITVVTPDQASRATWPTGLNNHYVDRIANFMLEKSRK